jgi:hypothetical protein
MLLEDGSHIFLRKVGGLSTEYAALCPRSIIFHNLSREYSRSYLFKARTNILSYNFSPKYFTVKFYLVKERKREHYEMKDKDKTRRKEGIEEVKKEERKRGRENN